MRDRWNCRRKLCHLDYLSALMHARRLNHDRLVIFPAGSAITCTLAT